MPALPIPNWLSMSSPRWLLSKTAAVITQRWSIARPINCRRIMLTGAVDFSRSVGQQQVGHGPSSDTRTIPAGITQVKRDLARTFAPQRQRHQKSRRQVGLNQMTGQPTVTQTAADGPYGRLHRVYPPLSTGQRLSKRRHQISVMALNGDDWITRQGRLSQADTALMQRMGTMGNGNQFNVKHPDRMLAGYIPNGDGQIIGHRRRIRRLLADQFPQLYLHRGILLLERSQYLEQL